MGGLGLSILLQGCASPNYFAQHTVQPYGITISKTEFDSMKKDVRVKRPYVLVKNNKLEFPICVYRFNETEYSALYLKCTHQGCEIQPQGDFLVCPCHGSEYSSQGKVINPPADKDLRKFLVMANENSITIQL